MPKVDYLLACMACGVFNVGPVPVHCSTGKKKKRVVILGNAIDGDVNEVLQLYWATQ